VEHHSVVPDLICLGKALTGCLPMSACVGKNSLMAAWPKSRGEALHTSTFLGNPLASAAALASLEEFEKISHQEDIQGKGVWFLNLLKSGIGSIPWVIDIRGRGMMLGIELDSSRGPSAEFIMRRLLQKGIIVLPSGGFSLPEVISITPPLWTPKEILEWCAEQIREAFEAFEIEGDPLKAKTSH
jgi:acetylornithine/succinyldiaminopimelate/putrescine aminotransferase